MLLPWKKKEKENTLEVQLMQLPKWEKKNNPATRFFFFFTTEKCESNLRDHRESSSSQDSK